MAFDPDQPRDEAGRWGGGGVQEANASDTDSAHSEARGMAQTEEHFGRVQDGIAIDKDWDEEPILEETEVDFEKLTATQEEVDLGYVRRTMQNPKSMASRIQVWKYPSGRMYIADGHHRALAHSWAGTKVPVTIKSPK